VELRTERARYRTEMDEKVPRFDFDALYRGQSPAPGIPAMASPPWDTRAPDDFVIGWHEAGLIRGDVLDVGCGLGDNAIYLVQQGHDVTGLDISPAALSTARQRAEDAGVDLKFVVGDATELGGYSEAFDTVIDCGMYHCLDDNAMRGYLLALHRATRSGARLLLGCFSDDTTVKVKWPRSLSERSLRDGFDGTGWDIATLEPATLSRDGRPDIALWLVQADRS